MRSHGQNRNCRREGASVPSAFTRTRVLLAAVIVTANGLTGCASELLTPPGMFSVFLKEPYRPLVPGNTGEIEGTKVMSAVWTPLITFDKQTQSITYDGAAESVTSSDNVHWTIKIKPGWTFHDGTPVTAESYVRAWNYSALSTNAHVGSHFFSPILGYDDVQAEEGRKPKSDRMIGLWSSDPVTIHVSLSQPFSVFPLTLGYHTFDPLPEVFYVDPVASGRKPIGQGPFKADTEWVPGQGMTLSRYDNYAGKDKAQSRGVVLRAYAELSTAYTDVLAGNLDILRSLPPGAYGDAKDIFKGRYLEHPGADITSLSFSLYDRRYNDIRVRRALSMAIDRNAIVNAIFLGTRVPADSFGPPGVIGYREGACGRWCEYHPEESKRLLAEVGFDKSQPIDIWFEAGAGHDVWATAVGNMFRKIGLRYRLHGNLQLSEYLTRREAKEMPGLSRTHWAMDYPSIENFLSPPAGYSGTFYASKAFEAALQAANRSPSIAEANIGYAKAEDILIEDLPSAPLFFGMDQTVWSKRVSNVHYDIFDNVVLQDVIVDDTNV